MGTTGMIAASGQAMQGGLDGLVARLEACVAHLRALEPERIRLSELAESRMPAWPAELTYQFRDASGEMRTARMSPAWIDRHARSNALRFLSHGAAGWAAAKQRTLAAYRSACDTIFDETGVSAIEAEADSIGLQAKALREQIEHARPDAVPPQLKARALDQDISDRQLTTSIIQDLQP